MDKRKKIIIITAVIGTIAYLAISFYIKSTRNVIEQMVAREDLINVLIAGRNSYKDNTFNFYALVTINPKNNNIGITFIPPDYRVMMNDSGSNVVKISEVDFSNFDRIRYSLQTDLQLNVPFYIKVYAADVKRVIDMIEGINIFSLDQAKCIFNGKTGPNYLDGKKTVDYINCADEIYIKYCRILDVLLTLYNERENLKDLVNIEFVNEIIRDIRTNFMPQEMFSLIKLVMNKGNCMSTLLPGGFTSGYYVVDDINFKTYQQDFLSPLLVNSETEANSNIKILNGTSVPGLARKLRNDLIREGLNITEFGTSNYGNFEQSIFICRQSDIITANRIAEITGINKIYFVTDTTQIINILIIIGEDMVSEKKTGTDSK